MKDIQFEGLTHEESEVINALNRRLPQIAKEENQSNEVALSICFLQNATETEVEVGVAFGDELFR